MTQNNLKIIDFSSNEINGGSIEVVCAKKDIYLKSKKIKIKKIISKKKKKFHVKIMINSIYELKIAKKSKFIFKKY